MTHYDEDCLGYEANQTGMLINFVLVEVTKPKAQSQGHA